MGDASPGQTDKKIAIRVVWGHLAFASYPVVVGHYSGDTIAGSEARLDQALGFRLTERRRLGLYPGPIGSSLVVLDAKAGAVVVGLGEPASLSIGALRRALRHGILSFAATQTDQFRSSPTDGDDAALLHLSALLVGAGEGGLDQFSCVQALLQAAKEAQGILSKIELPARLEEIEIVELYADRAYATLRAVKRAISSDAALNTKFDAEPEVAFAPYGRRSAPVEVDPSWWQPIQITMSDDPRQERSLCFTIGGGFARAEARTIAANLDLVAPLVRRVTRSKTNDAAPASPGRALFELLWPASLKDQSSDERNRRLILDKDSATFPWELLDDRRPWTTVGDGEPSEERGPPAVRAGMIRQLLQTRFREEILAPGGKPKALIIGNPGGGTIDGFPDLKAAEEEAAAIAGILKEHEVVNLGRSAGPEEICRNLFTDAWEIVHISAHGVLRQQLAGTDGAKRTVTGIVLGGGVVLGPSALAKLPVSPGIVFVNCCHLGDVGGGEQEARDASLAGRPEFAASVAVELIKLGARCVVVAGWAVNDKAAAVFGKTFYDAMLNAHETFGNAILLARKKTYADFPNSNTWGAYQCYGDPAYRLRPNAARSRTRFQPSDFVAIPEAIDAVRQVRDDLNVGVERDENSLKTRLDEIEVEIRENRGPAWLATADLRIALAEARGELGDLAKAIEHYEAAVGGQDTSFKVRAFEQLANLRVRYAIQSLREAAPEPRSAAATEQEIRKWLKKIEDLTALLGRTSERLALQGACWKRIAQTQSISGEDPATALEEMARLYRLAAENAEPRDRPYSQLMECNALICRALCRGQTIDGTVEATLDRLMSMPLTAKGNFWERIHSADAKMNSILLRVENPESELAGLFDAYATAWNHQGSLVKLRSVMEQLDFYQDVLSSGDATTRPKRDAVIAFVSALRKKLEGLVSEPSS